MRLAVVAKMAGLSTRSTKAGDSFAASAPSVSKKPNNGSPGKPKRRRKAREFGTRPERNFADAAEKYLIDHAHQASTDTDALHITALLPFIGKRPLRQIHDATVNRC
jgi:hypothetical protein